MQNYDSVFNSYCGGMTIRTKKHLNTLRVLAKVKPSVANHVIQLCEKDLILCVCEICNNLLKGHINLTKTKKQRLSKHKGSIRLLSRKTTPITQKRKVIQRGGFLGAILSAVLPILSGLFTPKTA